jgi:hypothetical protein
VRGIPETPGDRRSQKTIILYRLICEPKETEEDECGKYGRPSSELEYRDGARDLFGHGPGNLDDDGMFRVDVIPGGPWVRTQQNVGDDGLSGQGDGEDNIDGGHNNKTPVSAVSQVGAGADEISELPLPFDEGTNGEG